MTTPTPGPMDGMLCVDRDTFCLSATTGQILPGGDQGLFIADTRVLHKLVLHVNGRPPVALSGALVGSGAARFCSSSFGANRTEDPTVFVDRRRVVADSMVEDIRLTNFGLVACRIIVELFAASDFAYIFDVRHGRVLTPAPASATQRGLRFDDRQADRHVLLHPTPTADVVDPDGGRLLWSVTLPARRSWDLTVAVGFGGPSWSTWPTRTWRVASEHPEPAPSPPWSPLEVACSTSGLVRLVERSMTDLASLLVADPRDTSDRFLAAGSPWYLTLFGRDALWASRMMLPVGVDLARHTLTALARRQGQRHDADTGEEPGKILHEVRHGGLVERSDLPPQYYGSVDATPLWITTLSEAWRWGMADEHVERLLPACERAVGWMLEHGDADGDGFLEYLGGAPGLPNQGWKDSFDAICFANGELAKAPIALCEVQGYAHDAAVRAAELFERFDRPGADRCLEWADALQRRFRAAFWIDDDAGAYPALALDGDKRKVDAVASNMGHLPGTGLVDDGEIALIADRLSAPDMATGWGLRTLSADAPRFNPLSYHCGSVWPHDTVIAAAGLALAGHGGAAMRIVGGLVEAAEVFHHRLPELFGGEQRLDGMPPLPYPAACRPQAWSAASVLLLIRCVLGIEAHAPDGKLRLRPVWPAPFARLDVGGLQVGGGPLSLSVVAGQGVWLAAQPEALEVEVVGATRLDQPPGR